MRRIWALVAAVALSAAGLTAGKTQPDIPISLWFDNTLGQGLTSDNLTASANGVIADYIDGLQNMLAIIQGGGNFRFSTQDNTRQAGQRSLCLDFGAQYPGSLPFGNGGSFQCVNILQAMHSYGTAITAIAGLHPGQSVQKLVRFGWPDGGYYYRLGSRGVVGHDRRRPGSTRAAGHPVTAARGQRPDLASERLSRKRSTSRSTSRNESIGHRAVPGGHAASVHLQAKGRRVLGPREFPVSCFPDVPGASNLRLTTVAADGAPRSR